MCSYAFLTAQQVMGTVQSGRALGRVQVSPYKQVMSVSSFPLFLIGRSVKIRQGADWAVFTGAMS